MTSVAILTQANLCSSRTPYLANRHPTESSQSYFKEKWDLQYHFEYWAVNPISRKWDLQQYQFEYLII